MITDEFSRYPVVEVTSSTSANATIPVLDKVISAFGIVRQRPFNSAAFEEFAKNIGSHHRRITPRCMAPSECPGGIVQQAPDEGSSCCTYVKKKKPGSKSYITSFGNTATLLILYRNESYHSYVQPRNSEKIASNFILCSPPVVRSRETTRQTCQAQNEDKQHELGSGHQKWRHRLDQKRNWEQINTGVQSEAACRAECQGNYDISCTHWRSVQPAMRRSSKRSGVKTTYNHSSPKWLRKRK